MQVSGELSDDEHDYTEGASAIDIQNAITESRGRSRRLSESQIGFSYGDGIEQGSVFDGPGHVAIPSSVSRMSHRDMSTRRSQELRRMSNDLGAGISYPQRPRRRSDDGDQLPSTSRRNSEALSIDGTESGEEASGEEGDLGLSTRRRRRRRSPSPPEAMRSSVFENIANLFGARAHAPADESSRRPSFSHRSSLSRRSRRSRSGSRASIIGSEHVVESEDEEERWGYSSGEEDDNSSTDDLLHRRAEIDLGASSDIDYGSLPPSPTGSLPNMALDPIFGDTRIDMETPPEPSEPPPPGLPSRQSIYLPDEEISVRFIGYETIRWKQWVWRLGCILSFGLLGLLGHWFPRLWLRWVAQEKAFQDSEDGFVVVEVHSSFYSNTISHSMCKTPYRDISLFSVKIIDYPYALSTALPTKANSESTSNGKASDILKTIKVVDYRYSRFILDPRNGLFSALRQANQYFCQKLSSDVLKVNGGIILGRQCNLSREDLKTLFSIRG